jgi:hypothetical protein
MMSDQINKAPYSPAEPHDPLLATPAAETAMISMPSDRLYKLAALTAGIIFLATIF